MDDPSSMPAPPDGDRVFELVESTHRYLLTRERARDLFRGRDRKTAASASIHRFSSGPPSLAASRG